MDLKVVSQAIQAAFVSICEQTVTEQNESEYLDAAEDLKEVLQASSVETMQSELVIFVMKYPNCQGLLRTFDQYAEASSEEDKLKSMQDLMKKGDYDSALGVARINNG